MAGKTVDLKFRADLSQLVAEMKGLPGMTEKEAKKMAASLERQLKKAEKASVKAAKATKKAWKASTKAANSTGDAMGGLAGKLGKVEHVGGETSSVMSGIAGAMNTVNPAAGAMAQTLGDVSGGIEMVARSGSRLAIPLAILTGAVLAATKAWEIYGREQAEVQAALEKTKARRLALAGVMLSVDEQMMDAKKELALAEGKITQKEFDRHTARMSQLRKSVGEEGSVADALQNMKAEAETASRSLADAVALENDARTSLNRNSHASTVAYSEANKAAHQARQTHQAARQEYEKLNTTIDRNADAFAEVKDRRRQALDQLKKSTAGGKRAKTVIQQLREETEKLLPKEEIDKVAELTQHLERLEAAAEGSQKAANKLARSIVDTTDAIADLNAKRAADELAAMVAEIDKLAPAATISRMAELEAAQRLINDAIAAGGDEAEELGRKLAQVNDAIREESAKTKEALISDQADQAKKAKAGALELKNAYLSAYGSINSAASMVADEVLARAEEAAAAEIDSRQEAVDKTESLLADALAHRDSLRDQEQTAATRREIAATNARIEQLGAGVEAERAALETTRELQNQAIQRAFTAQQALRIAEITMNTAGAIMNAAATVPTPALPFVLGGLAALGATQIALVGAQEPPTMHLGGIVGGPDERTITARAGEGVLTRQGVNAIGGEAGVASANRGQGGGAMVVQMVYKHRVLDEVLTDSVRRGGPIGSAINRRSPRGRRNPHGRRAS